MTHICETQTFSMSKYPTITYKMKTYKKTGDGYLAVGDLTLHGVTKEITLEDI